MSSINIVNIRIDVLPNFKPAISIPNFSSFFMPIAPKIIATPDIIIVIASNILTVIILVKNNEYITKVSPMVPQIKAAIPKVFLPKWFQ